MKHLLPILALLVAAPAWAAEYDATPPMVPDHVDKDGHIVFVPGIEVCPPEPYSSANCKHPPAHNCSLLTVAHGGVL